MAELKILLCDKWTAKDVEQEQSAKSTPVDRGGGCRQDGGGLDGVLGGLRLQSLHEPWEYKHSSGESEFSQKFYKNN